MLATADHAPPPGFLTSPTTLDSPHVQPKCRRNVQQLCRCQRHQPRIPSLSRITHHRYITLPRQCDVLHRCRCCCCYRHHHRCHCHCGHHSQGAMQRWTQPTGWRHCTARGPGGGGRPCDAMWKGSRDVRHWHFGMEWVSSFWAVLYSFVLIYLFY